MIGVWGMGLGGAKRVSYNKISHSTSTCWSFISDLDGGYLGWGARGGSEMGPGRGSQISKACKSIKNV